MADGAGDDHAEEGQRDPAGHRGFDGGGAGVAVAAGVLGDVVDLVAVPDVGVGGDFRLGVVRRAVDGEDRADDETRPGAWLSEPG
ncbi:hypothetical protein [Amycolatopsis sp. CA-128772]|uniref:hypothetical protein n=1 Tax=Amycolatopsis sp. CA-128772 TaxID=2073159 RepID=UPI000CD2C3A3|nr:hypothetical protein [Amycolatopsis sp. CA-128772]